MTTEQYNEYNFISGQYQQLLNVEQSIRLALKKKPKDINLVQSLRKVQHDLQAITPIIQEFGFTALEEIEAKYDFEFKFLVRKKEEKESKLLKV